jgi:hypothetical protein
VQPRHPKALWGDPRVVAGGEQGMARPKDLYTLILSMESSDRQRKKESAQKKKNYSIYSKKAVRNKLNEQSKKVIKNAVSH